MKMPAQNEIEKQIVELNHMMLEDWKSNFVFSGKWWLLFILTIVPWVLWWKIVDKTRITEILLCGFFVTTISTFLDVVGWNFSLWYYPNTLLGLCTPLVPIYWIYVDLSVFL